MVVDAVITKQQLGECAAQYGKANAKPFKDALSGTLIYSTFIGTFDEASRTFIGGHHFTPGKSEAATDFNKLPGVKKCQ